NSPLNKSKKYWSNYIKYIDRDEAVRNEHYKEFSMIGNEEERTEEEKERNKKYIDYMGNPKKTSGLFTEGKPKLTQAEKKKYKDAFQTAEKNNSVMFQHVISFDNEWLAKQGIYDPKIGMLDEKRL
ncbi:relaxase MobL, partial [Listeria monocytogenes]